MRKSVWMALPLAFFACHSDTAPKPVTCTAANNTTDTASHVNLAVGQSIVLSPAQATCLEIEPKTNSEYVIGVVNIAPTSDAAVALDIHGSSSTTNASAMVVSRAMMQSPGAAFRAQITGRDPRVLRFGEALHARHLRIDQQLVALRGGPARAHNRSLAAARPRHVTISRTFSPKLNDTLSFYIDNINTDQNCTQGDTVKARAVYIGSKADAFEDVNAPLKGQLDSYYQQIGAEFDNVIYPMLLQYFGDPLAYDSHLGNKGKVLMLFSPILTNDFQGVAGFVNSCDFFPYDTSANDSTRDLVSNEAAIFYAYLPTSATVQNGFDPVADWKAYIRGVLAHESKHLASYAAKFSDGADSLEDPWLEEATAQISAEIYARVYSGAAWKGNTTYQTSVGCEPPLTTYNGCSGDRPQVMLDHFAFLYDYLSNTDDESPILPGVASYYGGAWSFVRWSVDQYASSEAGMLKAINQTTKVFGIPNLEAQTGAPFADMISDWSLASALAAYDSLSLGDAKLKLPSWDQQSIFAGMHAQLVNARTGQPAFPLAYPLFPHQAVFGAFDVMIPALPGGGTAFVLVSGTRNTRQPITIRNPDGTPLADGSSIRVGVVRIQ